MDTNHAINACGYLSSWQLSTPSFCTTSKSQFALSKSQNINLNDQLKGSTTPLFSAAYLFLKQKNPPLKHKFKTRILAISNFFNL